MPKIIESLPAGEVVLLPQDSYYKDSSNVPVEERQNINSAEAWDICLESEFDTLADVNAYAVHPDHVAAAGILKDAKEGRACVDYEF